MTRSTVARLALVALVFLPAASEAQRPGRRPMLRDRAQAQGESLGTGRARLEAEVRRNFARRVQQQVGLSDEQMRRLGPITQRHEQQRRQLQVEERDARQSLRQLMLNEQTADAKQVDQQLQRLVEVQKRRAALLESEQRDLGQFMTPFQRAKFLAMQDQIRRNLEQMRQRRVP
ncbi:MAG: hypothetical protein ACRENU_09775 [Gemmatimonadaceae bacterium]